MNNKKLMLILVFLYALIISNFWAISYLIHNNNQLQNALYFVIPEEEEEEEEAEKKENNNPNEIIHQTFLLDNSQITIIIQCLIETIILTIVFWYSFLRNSNAYKSFCQKNKKNQSIFKYSFSTFNNMIDNNEVCSSQSRRGMVNVCLIYFIIHAIIIFPLTLIFKFTSKNSYWYLWKNYWKNHFNNLGSCLFFLLNIILLPNFSLMFHYLIESKKADGDQADQRH